MTMFYLIRHGQKQNRVEDKLLSEEGVRQAEITGTYLNKLTISSLYASPLKRTQQTAEIIAKYINLPIITDERLRERINFGERLGETFEEFLNEWNKTQQDRDYHPTHGDSSIQTGQRMRAVLGEIHAEGIVVIVTHGGAIGDFLMNIFPAEQLPISPDPDSGAPYVEIKECSITEVEKDLPAGRHGGGTFILKKVNDTSHLL